MLFVNSYYEISINESTNTNKSSQVSESSSFFSCPSSPSNDFVEQFIRASRMSGKCGPYGLRDFHSVFYLTKNESSKFYEKEVKVKTCIK
jgi:hypothetical protein